VCIALWNATYPAIVLLLVTIGTALDVRGRWNAALGGALGLGTAIGPLVAGAALDVGYVTLGGVMLAITMVAVVLITSMAYRTDQEVSDRTPSQLPGSPVL